METKFIKQWKELAHQKKLSSSDMACLALYKAINQKKYDPKESAIFFLKRSFRPITKASKLANGAYPDGALWSALYYLPGNKWAKACESFNFLTPEEQATITEFSKTFFDGRYMRIKWDIN